MGRNNIFNKFRIILYTYLIQIPQYPVFCLGDKFERIFIFKNSQHSRSSVISIMSQCRVIISLWRRIFIYLQRITTAIIMGSTFINHNDALTCFLAIKRGYSRKVVQMAKGIFVNENAIRHPPLLRWWNDDGKVSKDKIVTYLLAEILQYLCV